MTKDQKKKDRVFFHPVKGRYKILKVLAKGGMGKVYLTYDNICKRKIALKKIRQELFLQKKTCQRFINEARITCRLTHPSIIPIYTIQEGSDSIFYTMPFIRGKTLKDLLLEARRREKRGGEPKHFDLIPTLIRIFINICQTIAYAHSQKILHRDIKPENIVIGPYGELYVLDWGLACFINEQEENDENESQEESTTNLTQIGKVVGTVSFMAPELALKEPASVQTDIYSLGVILYMILTLRSPFKRTSLKKLRENMYKECIQNPIKMAPYRDIPIVLASIAMRCLEFSAKKRYTTVNQLIYDLEGYLEGRPDWFKITELNLDKKSCWEFEENVLLTEYTAITRQVEYLEWVHLMISKQSFSGNVKMEMEIKVGGSCRGFGLLMGIPEAVERKYPHEGYCLHIGTSEKKGTRFFDSMIQVVSSSDVFLKRNVWYKIRLEKIENNLYFYLNDTLQLSYINYLPILGTHVGIMFQDRDFEWKHFNVYTKSQSINVSCLAVPDAFLAHHNFTHALAEYRRIASSFFGRKEGREAIFRSGITLLEQARQAKNVLVKEKIFKEAYHEFERLQDTPSAPIEYLGKALIFLAQDEVEEEAKCFELALRRYEKHPLLSYIYRQIHFRMQASSRSNRKATYLFSSIVARLFPKKEIHLVVKQLFEKIEKNGESLYFIDKRDPDKKVLFSMILVFWLAQIPLLKEIVDQIMKKKEVTSLTLVNVLFCLLELGAFSFVKNILTRALKRKRWKEDRELLLLDIVLKTQDQLNGDFFLSFIKEKKAKASDFRYCVYLLRYLLHKKRWDIFDSLIVVIKKQKCFSKEKTQLSLTCLEIERYLWTKNWKKVSLLFDPYKSFLDQETPLHFLYACYLIATSSKKSFEKHVSSLLDIPYPHTYILGSYYFKGKINSNRWKKEAFLWEKRSLWRQLSLYFHCLGEKDKTDKFYELEIKTYLH